MKTVTKSNRLVKIVSIVLMVCVLLSIANSVFAMPSAGSIKGSYGSNTKQIQDLGSTIIGIVTTVGIVASVLVLVILGVKYMMGSAEEKAEYKKTMIPYLIGAVLVFAASAIAGIVQGIAGGFTV